MKTKVLDFVFFFVTFQLYFFNTICFKIDTLKFDSYNVSFLTMTGIEAGIKPTLNLKVKTIFYYN